MRRLLLVAVAALSLIAFTPTPTSALSGCTTAYNDQVAWVRCPYGTGHVRVAASIVNSATRATKTIFGPWVGVGVTSRVGVPSGWLVFQVGPRFSA